MSSLPDVLTLDGCPLTRGQQHGRQAAGRIAAFLGDGLARLDTFLGPDIRLSDLEADIAAYGAAIERETPELYREIIGLSEGAGISMDEAVLLQVRRELAGFSRFKTSGDCTTFARTGEGAVIGQTVDLAGDLDDQVTLLKVRDAASGHCALVMSFTGLLGYLGVNDRGLAVGLNLVLAGDWRPGLPPYLAIRHLLDTCGSVDEAITCLQKLDLASSRCFMLCDGASAAFVEAMEGRLAVHRGAELTHTNHFLDPAFAPHDELNIFAQNGSRKRFEACRNWLASHGANREPESYFDLFSAEPVRVKDSGNRAVEKTVASVVLDPVNRCLHVRAGDPFGTPTVSFDMVGWGENRHECASA